MQCMGNLGCFPWGKQAVIIWHYSVFSPCVQCFHVSIIHQTLRGTTWSLTCVCDHSYACLYTQGDGHTDNESTQHFDSEKLSQIVLVLLAGFEPQVFGSRVRRSTNWATPVTPKQCGLFGHFQRHFLLLTRSSKCPDKPLLERSFDPLRPSTPRISKYERNVVQ